MPEAPAPGEAARILERAVGRVIVQPQLVLPTLPLAPVRVVRPDDLVHLVFHLHDLELESRGRRRVLVAAHDRRPGLLVVEHAPQHITEHARFEDAQGPRPIVPGSAEAPPVRALISGPSRLVFEVPHGAEIPYTVEGLLDACRTLTLRVGANAAPRTKPVVTGPWWHDDVHILDALYRRPRLRVGRERAAADVIGATRLMRTTAGLAHRFGLEIAAGAASASVHGAGLGRIRPELLPDADALLPKRKPRPQPPGDDLTGIELPWRLLLSPHAGAAWGHSTAPVERDGRVELWHTRLAQRAIAPDGAPLVDETPSIDRTVRAVWSRDREWSPEGSPLPPVEGHDDEPSFRMALRANDRLSIVHLSSDWTMEIGRRAYVPEPVDVRSLALSAFGGWLDVSGRWDDRPQHLDLEEWKHLAAGGRDTFVRVVRAGFLFPFGHRASFVEVTERKIAFGVAHLYKRQFVVVRERTRRYTDELTYDGPDGSRDGERLDLQLPFRTLTIDTLVTPNLDEHAPPLALPSGMPGRVSFPYVDERPFSFKVVGVDLDDNTVELNTPLLFVSSANNALDPMRAIAAAYNVDELDGRTTASVRGQRVAMARSSAPDDTAIAVSTMTWSGEPIPRWFDADHPMNTTFVPIVRHAHAVLPAASRLAGEASATKVAYPDVYKRAGVDGDGNAGQVFLQLASALSMDFSTQSDRSGGFMSPNVDITGLSRLTGPIGGTIETVAAGTFDPIDFLQAAVPAKLFGAIDLWEIVDGTGVVPGDIAMPQFVTQALDAVGMLLDKIDRLRAQLEGLGTTAERVRQCADDLFDAVVAVLDPSIDDPADVEEPATLLATAITELLDELPTRGDIDAGIRRALDLLLRTVHDAVVAWSQIQQVLDSVKQGFAVPEVVTARLDWRPVLKDWTLPGDTKPIFKLRTPDAGLVLAVQVEVPTQGGEPRMDVTCSLTGFDLVMVGSAEFLVLEFDSISFVARAGKKPEVDVKLDEVRFAGVLEFVETLRSLIPLDGFSDPPALEVTPAGITSSFSLALPNIAVGVFSLENLSFAADLKVPFVGDSMEVSFSFCTREDPFRLIVAMFGGGGFFGITLTPAGIKRLEASFEFGASVALDFGVASGSLSVMAGIYFKMEVEGGREDAALSGYFRARGEVDVLGIISASIELYLELTYEVPTKTATGRATITVEIEVLFFSGSVELTCEKKFRGGNADPTFEETMVLDAPPGERPWDDWCRAYAEVA